MGVVEEAMDGTMEGAMEGALEHMSACSWSRRYPRGGSSARTMDAGRAGSHREFSVTFGSGSL